MTNRLKSIMGTSIIIIAKVTNIIFKAIPNKDCAEDAQSLFGIALNRFQYYSRTQKQK